MAKHDRTYVKGVLIDILKIEPIRPGSHIANVSLACGHTLYREAVYGKTKKVCWKCQEGLPK